MGGSEIMIMYIIMVDGIMLPEIMLAKAKGRWINDDQMGIKKELSQEKKPLIFHCTSLLHRDHYNVCYSSHIIG